MMGCMTDLCVTSVNPQNISPRRVLNVATTGFNIVDHHQQSSIDHQFRSTQEDRPPIPDNLSFVQTCKGLVEEVSRINAAVQLSETAPSHSVPSLCKHCADLEYDPKCVVKVNGIDVVGLRDTGATHCIVARELVRNSDYTGQYTELTTVSGHQYQVPIAQVDISSPFLYGRIAVAVMNQPE
ncbi:hypothetical protein ACOMHN_050715 [Nucella lapillus]